MLFEGSMIDNKEMYLNLVGLRYVALILVETLMQSTPSPSPWGFDFTISLHSMYRYTFIFNLFQNRQRKRQYYC